MNWLGRGNGNGQRWLRAVLLVVILLLVVFLAYRQIRRLGEPLQTVWAAASDLAVGSVIAAEDVVTRRIPESQVPPAPALSLRAVLGRILTRDKPAGGIFVREDFEAPAEEPPELAAILPAGRVMTRVRVMIEDVVMADIRFGDRLDLLASYGGSGGRRGGTGLGRTSVVARDVFFIGWVNPRLVGAGSGGGEAEAAQDEGLLGQLFRMPGRGGEGGAGGISQVTSMILALHPEHVLPVARAESGAARITMVLHGRAEVEAGELLVLPEPRASEVEVIDGPSRTLIGFVP